MEQSGEMGTAMADTVDRWRWRDWLAAVVLFAATAATVLAQNARVGVMWDISYLLDSSWRFSLGQVPYRDLPFVHAPLTFLVQAAIIRIGGRVFFHHVLYAAGVAGLGTVIAWRIALRTLRGRLQGAWAASVLLAAPLAVLGIYGIFPMPFYDCDCIFLVLVAAWLLQRVLAGSDDWRWGCAAGVVAVLTVFCKQNIGVPFLLAVCGGVAALLVLRRGAWRAGWMVLSGAAAAGAAGLVVLQTTVGFRNYYFWTVTFAGRQRLPGLGEMLAVYREPSLLWVLPCVAAGAALWRSRMATGVWVRGVAVALLAAPFVPPLLSLLLTTDADDRASSLLALWPPLLVAAAGLTVWRLASGAKARSRAGSNVRAEARTYLRSKSEDKDSAFGEDKDSATGFQQEKGRPEMGWLLPLALLAAIHGTLLSQQLWGSTYALWPLFVLLLAELVAALGDRIAYGVRVGSLGLAVLAAFAGGVLLVCGGFYTFSENRLTYAQVSDGPLVRSTTPALAGMTVRGPYLPAFEQLLDFAAREIPRDDGLLLLPGEDPFYYATGRTPRFPVLLLDRTCDPYSPEELVEQVRRHNIRWLIVKRRLQLTDQVLPAPEETMVLLLREFALERRLDGYEVYRRR
jgi:hypothetical protein